MHDETHVSAVQIAPRTHARLSRPDEHRRRTQGAGRAPREGPHTLVRLTDSSTASATRSASYRLRGAGAFESVFSLGVRYDAHFLQLIAAPATQLPGRVGYVLGRKAMPRAVDRNRLRRRLRERVRAARPDVERYDIILRARRTVARDDIAAAVMESEALLAKLVRRGT